MTQKELEKYLMDAAHIARGMIDAADFEFMSKVVEMIFRIPVFNFPLANF